MGDALGLTADVLEFGYGALAFLMGVGILVLRPDKRVNQALACLLIVDGLGLGGMASNMRSWAWAGASVQSGAEAAFRLGWVLIAPLYLWFTSQALRGGVAAWLRSRAGLLVIVGLLLAQGTIAFIDDGRFWFNRTATGVWLFILPLVGTGLVGLIGAFQNLRQAEGVQQRRQARAYLLAFSVRDVAYVAAYTFYGLTIESLDWSKQSAVQSAWLIALQAAWVVFLVFLAYGVLSGQVLDLDRRVRLVASRTIALGFVAIVFVTITESVERFLNVSNPIVGTAAAVLLAFLFRPVEHWAEGATRSILPSEPGTS